QVRASLLPVRRRSGVEIDTQPAVTPPRDLVIPPSSHHFQRPLFTPAQEQPESMIPLPDGTFRFSPRDLVAYLEGDFAAWCERMQAERARAGEAAGPHELEWVIP